MSDRLLPMYLDLKHLFFFFNDTASPEIYTLSLTTLFRSLNPRLSPASITQSRSKRPPNFGSTASLPAGRLTSRSEEHTSELQSRENLVCRLLLEKKKRGVNAARFMNNIILLFIL